MKRSFFKLFDVMLIAAFFSLAHLPTYSANATNTDITITNQTIDNQTGKFTYRIQTAGWRTIFTDNVTSLIYNTGYGENRICGANLENANDINKIKIQQALGPEIDGGYVAYRFLQNEDRVVLESPIATYYYTISAIFADSGYSYVTPEMMNGVEGVDYNACVHFTEPISTASLQVWMSMDLSAYGIKPDIYENNDDDPANEVFEFTLKNGESKTISILDGYQYTIWQEPETDWKLVDINGNASLTRVRGVSGATNIPEYVFTNRSLNNTNPTAPTAPTAPINPTAPTTPISPTDPTLDITIPSTGQTSAEFSATKTGIVIFAIIATIIRVIYLIRRYQNSKH